MQVCRITKLGWFDDSQHRELVEEVTKFLQATVDYCIIGLKVLIHICKHTLSLSRARTIPVPHRRPACLPAAVCV